MAEIKLLYQGKSLGKTAVREIDIPKLRKAGFAVVVIRKL